ncbi:MAG: 3-deoxy-D-manno-octulosonic acid transferase [Gammaproteobacteria bacterium]|jgi:3-deoxy-D-manno-octulosonic-acid transferase|nr:3-deoxy-D-manno-octulosonic acid transferase [Gammaproteobacteria bacterium]
MNRFVYTVLIILSLPFALLRILLRDAKNSNWIRKLKNQLGFVPKIPGKVIWLHCVSVGEFNAAKPLIDMIFINFPLHQIVISTTTITGSDAVEKYYKSQVIHCFFPFDVPFIVSSFLKKIKPVACILLETEIWPNLITKLKHKNIPVMLVNARLSKKSYKKYKKFSPKLINMTLNNLSLICSQNESSSKRLISLGATNNIITTGSLKFDSNEPNNSETIQALKNITGDRKIVVFASTRKGEEFQIIKSYLKLKSKFNALLIIVPRHPERFNEVFSMANETGLNVKRRSLGGHCEQDTDILIGDSMGEMMSYLIISDIAFIGGSLTNNGGQNMLEAASLSKPIIFGPSVFNFEEISKRLLDDGSAIQVRNAEELMKTISELLLDDEKRRLIGESAKTTFENNRGATTKIFNAIAPHIKNI